MIPAEKIIDMNHVEHILKNLIIFYSNSQNVYDENSWEFEHTCEKILDQLCEIDEFIICKEIINSYNLANANLRMFTYWEYIKKDLSTFDELLIKLKKYS